MNKKFCLLFLIVILSFCMFTNSLNFAFAEEKNIIDIKQDNNVFEEIDNKIIIGNSNG